MSRRIRVVIADDTSDIRALLRMSLEADGRFEVVGEAGDGVETISVVSNTQPDVVVLDLAMPVMDGLQALPEIRRRSDARVLVLSGFEATHMSLEATKRGADAYIEKGVGLDELARALSELCDRTVVPEPQPLPDDASPIVSVQVALSASLRTAAIARHLVDGLPSVMSEESREDMRLLLNEVVTNSLVHAGMARGGMVEVKIEIWSDRAYAEVIDNGPGFEVESRTPEPDEVAGRGLFLVEQLSDRWGVEPGKKTKVWFELSPHRGQPAQISTAN